MRWCFGLSSPLLGGPDNCGALQLLLLSRYFTKGTHVRAYNLQKPLIMGWCTRRLWCIFPSLRWNKHGPFTMERKKGEAGFIYLSSSFLSSPTRQTRSILLCFIINIVSSYTYFNKTSTLSVCSPSSLYQQISPSLKN